MLRHVFREVCLAFDIYHMGLGKDLASPWSRKIKLEITCINSQYQHFNIKKNNDIY